MTSACENKRGIIGDGIIHLTEKVGDTMTQEQFEQLLNIYGDAIFGFCCHLTGSRTSAEDLYQEAVPAAFSKLRSIRGGDLEKAKNYIIGIAVKLNKNRLRKHSNRDTLYSSETDPMLVSIADTTDIEGDAEKREMNLAVRRIIAELPKNQRTVLYMYYYAEMSIRDIAMQLKCSDGTVKSRLSRGRKHIKDRLEEMYHE